MRLLRLNKTQIEVGRNRKCIACGEAEVVARKRGAPEVWTQAVVLFGV